MVTKSAKTTVWDPVDTFHLPTVLATFPIHIFTALFIVIVMISILKTRHLHSRPRSLLAINCLFFVIASVYDLAFDISYLTIMNRPQITIQECSAIRNFVYNPIATQAFVDALERFLLAFYNIDMPLYLVFTFYSLFPLTCIAMAIYNTFIATTFLENDDLCAIVRRTSWTNIALILIQWGSAVIATILYVAIWKKVRQQRKFEIPSPEQRDRRAGHTKMTTDHYYWDHSVVKVFFISCLIPLVLAIPSSLFTILTEFNIYQNSTVNIIGIVTLDVTTPITWLLYISCIGHIRRSLFDCLICIRCKTALRRHIAERQIADSNISMEKIGATQRDSTRSKSVITMVSLT